MFRVEAIPHTFSVDAEGALQDEYIGDASIGGKLKKLIARARETQAPRSKRSKPNSRDLVSQFSRLSGTGKRRFANLFGLGPADFGTTTEENSLRHVFRGSTS